MLPDNMFENDSFCWRFLSGGLIGLGAKDTYILATNLIFSP